jgi:tetratricopeptide (TPR) repeat protein
VPLSIPYFDKLTTTEIEQQYLGMAPESGPVGAIPGSAVFPPRLLPFSIIENTVSDAAKARLSILCANATPEPERFDREIKSKWTAIEVDPGSPLKFNGYEQLWETLQYGALLLRNQSETTSDTPLLKICCRWCEMLHVLWDKTRNDAAMEILVLSWEVLLLQPTTEGVRRYDILSGALKAYRSRYEASKDRTGFREARLTVDEMVDISRPGREQVEANTLRGRLFGTRMDDVSVLTETARNIAVRESVRSLKKATEILRTVKEKEDSDADVYNFLAFALTRRFDIGHRKSDIEEAISNRTEALRMITEHSQLWIGWADNLARAYWTKFTEYSQVKDAESGISIFEDLLKIDPDNPHAGTGLAELIRQRAASLVLSNADRQLISARAIELLENIVVNTSDTDRAMPSRLGKCSSALADRFRTDSVIQDIDVAIALQTAATNLQPLGARWFHLKELCEYHIIRHNISNAEEDIVSALAKGKECVEAAGPMKKNRSDCLLQYGCAQATGYQKTHAPEMLSEAIISMREAEKLSTEVLWRNVAILENLAKMLEIRFRLTGAYDDAAEGIRLIKEAIDMLRRLTGKGNHSREARCLNTLGELFLARYNKYGAAEDIDEAIRACHSSLEATDIEHVEYVLRAKNLSHVLGIRYGLLGKTIDFETAQTLVNSTLDSLQRRTLAPSERETAMMLNQKGANLLHKAVRIEDNELLAPAIQSFSEAVRLVPGDTAYSSNLATATKRVAISAPNHENSKLALMALQKHVGTVMNQVPTSLSQEGPAVLHSMAEIQLARAKKYPNDQGIGEMANTVLKQLVDLKPVKSADKIWAAGELAVRLYQTKDYAGAAKYINTATDNLPHVTMYGLSRADQLKAFQPHSNLPKFALAFNILAEAPLGKSLQIWEQSRSILWDRLLSEHNPVSELQTRDAELAQEFEDLRIRLHKPRAPALAGDRVDGMAFKTPDQYKDAEDYLLMLDEIRKLPGLGDFFKLQADDHDFAKYAEGGPVVVVNCVGWYGHAVLVTRTGIINLHLPDFSEALAKLTYEKMQEAIHYMRKNELQEANAIYLRVLNTLWRTVACPILDNLEQLEFSEHRNTNKDLPRLWWVTNGWMNLLPIHAAGNYFRVPDSEKDANCTVMDRVVSSYIPSFRALEYARRNAATRSANLDQSPHDSFLIVFMPHTPNEASLRFASAEIAATKPILPISFSSITELEEPTSSKVLSVLKAATHAHFICHGAVFATDPTLSHLKLGILPSGKPSSLEVRSILQASMPQLRSIFLSACNTGTTGNMSLKDESLHVSGAFLMKGVPEVVASRWEVVDELSVEVATWYYEALAGKGCDANRDVERGGALRSARALHEAVRTARQKGENAMYWGSYVHYGV